MRRLFVALAVLSFVSAGAAAQNIPAPDAPDDVVQSNSSTEELKDQARQAVENRTNISKPEEIRGAQFDARLMTAIQTLEFLVNIAPSDDAGNRIERALEILKDVQNDTDTRSLEPGNVTEVQENQTGESGDSQERKRQGPPENTGNSGQEKSKGRSGSGRPGFVES
ncbi:MAG: hypothetical protein ABEJ72_10765, partial [Candidatus Aenigmatarchaeota archaeon]